MILIGGKAYGSCIFNEEGGVIIDNEGIVNLMDIQIKEENKISEIGQKLTGLIKLSIAKGVDLEFSECCDFHDAQTFNIFLSVEEKWLYESERVNFSSPSNLEREIVKAMLFLEKRIR